jgi:hypothetical protein
MNPRMLLSSCAFVLLAAGLLSVSAHAAPPAQTPTEAPHGVITGRVENGTTGQWVGAKPVRLRHWNAEAEQPPLTGQTDAQGRFHFDGLDTGNHAFYRVEADYQGVPFHSEFITFEPGATQTVASLKVYETTDRADMIKVQRFHFIIMARERGILSVLELYQFSNQGERAYAGTVNPAGQRETVRIALPEGGQDLVLQSGTLGVDFLAKEGELVATSPLLPGGETFDVAFLYAVPYSTPSITLDHRLYYDTAEVNGLLMDMGADMTSEALTLVGERAAQGQTFLQFTGQNLKAGQTLPIRLDKLDDIRFASAPAAASEETAAASGLDQTTLLWIVLGLGALLVAFGLFYPTLRTRLSREAAVVQSNPALEHQRLLLMLARLDQAYQAGQLNEAAYRRARAHRKAELADLWRRTQEQP